MNNKIRLTYRTAAIILAARASARLTMASHPDLKPMSRRHLSVWDRHYGDVWRNTELEARAAAAAEERDTVGW